MKNGQRGRAVRVKFRLGCCQACSANSANIITKGKCRALVVNLLVADKVNRWGCI